MKIIVAIVSAGSNDHYLFEYGIRQMIPPAGGIRCVCVRAISFFIPVDILIIASQ